MTSPQKNIKIKKIEKIKINSNRLDTKNLKIYSNSTKQNKIYIKNKQNILNQICF